MKDREIVLERSVPTRGRKYREPQESVVGGCEVHFRRETAMNCSELITISKWWANFTQAAKTLAHDDRPTQVILDEIGVEEDVIYRIVGDIRDQTRAMINEGQQSFRTAAARFTERATQDRFKKSCSDRNHRRP